MSENQYPNVLTVLYHPGSLSVYDSVEDGLQAHSEQ